MRHTATAGPIRTANTTVPAHRSPPRAHPVNSTLISITPLTRPMGFPLALCRPVIHPSRGPGPRLHVRYNALPTAIRIVPTMTLTTDSCMVRAVPRYGPDNSIVPAMITMFNTVPMPGNSLKGIQRSRTPRLTRKVAALHVVVLAAPLRPRPLPLIQSHPRRLSSNGFIISITHAVILRAAESVVSSRAWMQLPASSPNRWCSSLVHQAAGVLPYCARRF